MRVSLIGLISFILISLFSFSLQASTIDWKTVNGWNVRVDSSLGYGCFLLTDYKGGTVIRIGFNPENRFNGYLLVGNDKWKSLEEGKEYKISIQFDGLNPWEADAIGFKFGSKKKFIYLLINFESPDFLKEFGRKHKMKIDYNSRRIATLSLKGSSAALGELLVCQNAMMNAKKKSNSLDPFNESSGRSDDPFK